MDILKRSNSISIKTGFKLVKLTANNTDGQQIDGIKTSFFFAIDFFFKNFKTND